MPALGTVLSTTDIGPPIGILTMWMTDTAPTGWAICDGAAISRTTFAALFALLGESHGDPHLAHRTVRQRCPRRDLAALLRVCAFF